jgi:hypothetical protein
MVVECLPSRSEALSSNPSASKKKTQEASSGARRRWLTPVIPAPREAEIRRITVRNQPRETVQETLYQKNPSQKRAGGVAQDVALSSNPSTAKKKRLILKCMQDCKEPRITKTVLGEGKALGQKFRSVTKAVVTAAWLAEVKKETRASRTSDCDSRGTTGQWGQGVCFRWKS